MPNVDRSVRILNQCCSDSFANSSETLKMNSVNELIQIRDNHVKKMDPDLPVFLKKVSDDVLRNFVFDIHDKLKKILEKHLKSKITNMDEASNSNFVGADLVVKTNKNETFDIELKFGQETDKAIGLDTFGHMLIVNGDVSYFLNTFPNIIKKQHEYADKHPNDQIGLIDNLKVKFEKLCNEINDFNKNSKIKVNSDEIRAQLGGTGSNTKKTGASHPIKFEIAKINQIKNKPYKDMSGDWFIKEIEISNRPHIARFTIWISNGKTKAKCYFNWKNDYTYTDGYKYQAKTGMGSVSLNLWTYLDE